MPQVLLAVQDFANGFLWGRLFSHFQLQPDFDKFDDKRTPDAMVNNFTRLQVCGLGGSSSTTTSWSRVRVMHAISCRIRTTEKADTDHMATQSLLHIYGNPQPTFKRLGIAMNTRVANSMMREEPGVAMRLLYSVKQNIGSLSKDLQVRSSRAHAL
jgi:hypothetical protein